MSVHARSFFAAGFLALASFMAPSGPSAAAETVTPYDQAAFESAQKAAKPILVEITAPWCPTCAAQKPILAEIRNGERFKDLVTFTIDFDSQKKLVRQFGATMQSTLIVYKGATETGRSTGETRPASLKALLDKAV